jgi:hypothetical protein
MVYLTPSYKLFCTSRDIVTTNTNTNTNTNTTATKVTHAIWNSVRSSDAKNLNAYSEIFQPLQTFISEPL